MLVYIAVFCYVQEAQPLPFDYAPAPVTIHLNASFLLRSSESTFVPLEFSLALYWLPEFGLWYCSAEASMYQAAKSQMLF